MWHTSNTLLKSDCQFATCNARKVFKTIVRSKADDYMNHLTNHENNTEKLYNGV